MGKTELKIEIDSELLAQAREAGLSVEALVEAGVRRALSGIGRFRGLSDGEKAALWAQENAEAIEAQRKRIEKYGVFGEDLRTW
jgi:post-segregation antitoxin (ccd killing protein)